MPAIPSHDEKEQNWKFCYKMSLACAKCGTHRSRTIYLFSLSYQLLRKFWISLNNELQTRVLLACVPAILSKFYENSIHVCTSYLVYLFHSCMYIPPITSIVFFILVVCVIFDLDRVEWEYFLGIRRKTCDQSNNF